MKTTINLNKIYTVKSNATRDIRKAIERNECKAGEYEAQPVEGGFQIIGIRTTNEATIDVDTEMAMDANLPAPTPEQEAAMTELNNLLTKRMTAKIADATTPEAKPETGPLEYSNEELESRWHELVCIMLPNYESNEEALHGDWFIFRAGTSFTEIYNWFDNEYSEGVKVLRNKQTYFDWFPRNKNTKNNNGIPEMQIAVLNALYGAKTLSDKADDERAETWILFSDIHNSNSPHNLPKPSMAGIAGALSKRGLIKTDWGKDAKGKRAAIITITEAGIEALRAS